VQVPLTQVPEQQSAVVTQEDGGKTHAHTGAEGLLSSQNLLQQSPPPMHAVPTGEHGRVVVVVPLTHVWETLDEGGEQPGWQATPAGQQVRPAPRSHGVVPLWQPQVLEPADTHATPVAQHLVPHGVVPLGQQHELAGSVQMPPLGQHPCPHTCDPVGQVTAPPRKGLKMAAAAAAAPVAPRTFSAPRRLVGRAMARDRSSNDRFT
jgi:hypothetical protein